MSHAPSDSGTEAAQNTDREIWREREGDFYADSIHVTEGGDIGINCGGSVYVKPIREWHRLAGGPIGITSNAQASREHIIRTVLKAYGFGDEALDDLTWLRNTHAYAVASRVADALAD